MNELIISKASSNIDFNAIPYAEFVEEPSIVGQSVNFLESNTHSITLDELEHTCTVPTWGNQELTISHQDFVRTLHEAAQDFFSGQTINHPQVRVSHEVKGRIPSALHKNTSELLESDKTRFFQRLATAFTIPSITETINGQKMELCVAGVRNYSDLNLYRSSRGLEKFSIAIGWRVNVCSNQILTTQGVKFNIEVANLNELYMQVLMLFNQYSPQRDFKLMQSLTNTFLSEQQFANCVGRMRLYQCLRPSVKAQIPQLLITDSQVNSCCRGFYGNPNFGCKNNCISMWDFHNLLTESNKSSYIDSYLQRAINSTDVSLGICNALNGVDTRNYTWFLN